jgi:hypothetical protein
VPAGNVGQSRLTGYFQHFTTGEEWFDPHTVILGHAKARFVAVWPVMEG